MIKRIREEQDESQNMPASREAVPSAQVILEAEVDHLSRELTEREQTEHYQRNRYSVCYQPRSYQDGDWPSYKGSL